MRIKDEAKQKALFKATIKVVNKIGFASSSVSQIAKEAKVSPATIYVYYKDKEDLLISTYTEIKIQMSEALIKGFDESLPIRDIVFNVWVNGFEYVSSHQDQLSFIEQFAHSPYSDMVDKAKFEKNFEVLIKIFQRGIEQKIIKNVEMELLSMFIFRPILNLSNQRICTGFELSRKNIEKAFNLAWDAIKF
ncbi:MAG: TetR/AcrR family transcriptional regulator [Desulfobacteraceae bacterium]|jgi:AcrR family transcriptional regulator